MLTLRLTARCDTLLVLWVFRHAKQIVFSHHPAQPPLSPLTNVPIRIGVSTTDDVLIDSDRRRRLTSPFFFPLTWESIRNYCLSRLTCWRIATLRSFATLNRRGSLDV